MCAVFASPSSMLCDACFSRLGCIEATSQLPAASALAAMTLQLCAVPAADLVQCVWCGVLCPRIDHGATLCVKCSVYDSLQSEQPFEEDKVATTYECNNEYGDSTYEPPFDATYCDDEEENCHDLMDGTGGTLTEPQSRSACSMFLKLKAILPLGRQPIPVAQH